MARADRSRCASGTWIAMGAAAFLGARWALRRFPAYRFEGRTVLVTGGSRGLGLVLARELVRQGARVAIGARDAAELERARRDLSALGGEVFVVPCDITRSEQVEGMTRSVAERFGGIDVLINNAGVIEVGPLSTMTRDDFQEAMGVHFWGTLHTVLAALPHLRRREESRIVNIGSIGGKVAIPHLIPYCASKFALAGLSEGLRAELRPEGIRVTTVHPGLMRTGSARNAFFKGRHRAEHAWFSILDALPIISIGAERAARRILEACRRGDAELVLGLPARVAVTARAIAPAAFQELMALVDRWLPPPGGIGQARARGDESESPLSPSILTLLAERAALRNNELRRNGH